MHRLPIGGTILDPPFLNGLTASGNAPFHARAFAAPVHWFNRPPLHSLWRTAPKQTKNIEEIALKITELPVHKENGKRIAVITQGKDPTVVAADGKVSAWGRTSICTSKGVQGFIQAQVLHLGQRGACQGCLGPVRQVLPVDALSAVSCLLFINYTACHCLAGCSHVAGHDVPRDPGEEGGPGGYQRGRYGMFLTGDRPHSNACVSLMCPCGAPAQLVDSWAADDGEHMSSV